MNFEQIDSKSAVYRVTDVPMVHHTSVPAKAKSRFNDENDDVAYSDLRAEMKKIGGDIYVVVGECND